MYEAFFGLKERPFNLTPDPKYLYLSDKHKEAFAHLLFGIKNRSGFVMVTGEIGTGKTTICRNLINQLNQDVQLALIFNPSLNPVELMQKINAEFGIAHEATNVRELSDDLNAYLLSAAAQEHSCVLIIDEAQNLSPAVLEQIRLLSNLETETEKLLQIILIGQPELAEKLSLHELRQLNQRITARYHLRPLDQRETHQYIQYRLHVAGGRRKLKFVPAAIRAIFKHSGGTPRVINAVCDRCLLIAYTKETHVITPGIAKQAIREMRGAYREGSRGFLRRLGGLLPNPSTALFAGVVLVALAGIGALFAQPIRQLASELNLFNRILTGGVVATPPAGQPVAVAAPAAQPAPVAAAPATVPPATPLLNNVIETINRNSAPAVPPLAEQLTRVPAPESFHAGLAALLAAWDAPLNGDYPVEATPAAIQQFATRHKLTAESLKPALDQLLAINYPALVKVRVGGEDKWLGLVEARDGKLTLMANKGERLETTREPFAPLYQNEAIVLWRDEAPRTPALLPGRKGAAVTEIKNNLRRLGRIESANNSNEYDTETATAVSRIQSETGLLLDGMAGKQVRMVLTNWTGEPGIPRLDPASSRMASAVSAAPEPAPAVGPAPEPVRQPRETPVADEPLPEFPPAAQPAPGPAPAPENAQSEVPAPEATEEAPAPAAEETPAAPAEVTPEPSVASVVQVQELPEPVEGAWTPDAENPRKETTPPVDGSAPLVPLDG